MVNALQAVLLTKNFAFRVVLGLKHHIDRGVRLLFEMQRDLTRLGHSFCE
jgi:hypothetical protein